MNLQNDTLTGFDVTWESSDMNILSITSEGLVTAAANGSAEIRAIVDGVRSSALSFTVGASVKTATFSGIGSYQGEGTATLKIEDDNIILALGEDFKTSFALGTFVYLSNETTGAGTRSTGLELGEITSNGMHSFNATDIAAVDSRTLDFNEYRYVVILCKPASIPFAIADFEE